MNRLITILISILLSHMALTAKKISGQVVDRDSVPVEFANITAFSNDSVVGGGVTDSDGFFRIEAGDGCDRVRISFVGYDDVILHTAVNASPSPSGEDFGRIILDHASTLLKEVVVKAPLIRREADRIVMNIAANPLAANKDAHELLKTAPGVWATDDALSIYGQSGTTVYVDDRKVNISGPQLMTYLKTIQSSSVATIEIIPKAGAEFNADSSGGVIRINLRRSRIDGLSGSAGMNITAGEYKQFANPFVNIGLHSGKWSYNFNGNLNGSPSDRHTSREESVSEVNSMSLKGISRHKNKVLQGNIMAGIFFDASPKDRLGLQIDWNPQKNSRSSESVTEKTTRETSSLTTGDYENSDLFHNLNVTFNWSRRLDEEGSVVKLISNYNYQYSSVDEDNRMSWSDTPTDSVFKTAGTNRYNIFVTELSVNKKFSPHWTLGAGAKYTLNDVANESFHHYLDDSGWIPDRGHDYDDSYNENIAAFYATVNGQSGRWKFKAGIRGEYFTTRGDMISGSRFDLFPNAALTFLMTERGDYTVSLGYHRNIHRPSFWSLNPTVRQVSDYSYSVGNPSLRPSFTDAISLDFLLAGKFTVATGYSRTADPIRQMFRSDSAHPERMYLTWGNTREANNGFLHADGFINITPWWNLYSSLTYIIASEPLTGDNPDRSDIQETFGYLQLIASTTFILPKGFNLTVSCFYNSKMRIGNISVSPILNINPTIQKRFGDNWSMSFSMENLMQRTSKIRTVSSGYDRLTSTKEHIAAKISATYNFNSGKRFKSRRIESSADNSRLTKD